MSSKEIVSELFSDASLLVRRQVELARLEAQQQLKKERSMAELVGAGGALAYAGVILLLVAAALGIGAALDGRYWAGALIVGGAVLLIATLVATFGWSRRVKEPLPRSRHEVDKEISWAKSQLTT